MSHKQFAHGFRFTVNAERHHAAGFLRLIAGFQTLQGCNHLLAAYQTRRAGVSMELTVTREPHGDYAGQNTEHQLKHRGDREVDQRVAIAALPFIFPVAAEETGRNLRDNAGDKDNEGVHHPGSGSW